MAELPGQFSVGELVRMCNLGTPAGTPGLMTTEKLRWWLDRMKVPRVVVPALPGEKMLRLRVYLATDLEAHWPKFAAMLKAKLARNGGGRELLRAFEEEAA